MSNKNIILLSQFINNFGSAFSRIALVILITTWYKNPIYVGIYSFFLFLPRTFLSTPIGYLIDSRQDQKKVILWSSFLAALTILGVAMMVFVKIHSFVLLVVLATVYAVVSDVYDPCIIKITVLLFDKSEYVSINSSISSAMTAANLFSGIIVTYGMTFLSFTPLFMFDVMSYLIVIVLILCLKVPKKPLSTETSAPAAAHSNPIWNSFKVVKTFLTTFPYIIPVYLSAILFNILLAPMNVYLTQISDYIFNNPKSTGLLESFFSLGFLVGSLTYKIICNKVNVNRMIQLALLLVPTAVSILGLAHTLLLALSALVLLGIVIPFFNISSKAILQNRVSQSELGTVFNSYFASMNLSQPIGLLGIPVLISAFGIQPILVITGTIYLLAAMTLIGLNKFPVELNQ